MRVNPVPQDVSRSPGLDGDFIGVIGLNGVSAQQ